MTFLETGRYYTGYSKGQMVLRLFATTGKDKPLTGNLLYFTRTNANKEVKDNQVTDVSTDGLKSLRGD